MSIFFCHWRASIPSENKQHTGRPFVALCVVDSSKHQHTKLCLHVRCHKYMDLCMYIHTYIRTYTCMLFMSAWKNLVCVNTHVRTYVHTYMFVHTVCMYIRMYVCIYVRMHPHLLHQSTCQYLYRFVRTLSILGVTDMYVHHTLVYTYLRVYLHMYACMYVRTSHINRYVRTYIRTYCVNIHRVVLYMHVHTYIRTSPWNPVRMTMTVKTSKCALHSFALVNWRHIRSILSSSPSYVCTSPSKFDIITHTYVCAYVRTYLRTYLCSVRPGTSNYVDMFLGYGAVKVGVG